MSFRPRAEKKATATAPMTAASPTGINRLSHVLEVGLANRDSIDNVMTETQFVNEVDGGEVDMIEARSFAEVDKLVDINDPLLSLNKQEFNRLRSMAAGKASKLTNRAGDAAQRGAKKVARLTAEQLKMLEKEVKRKWEGSDEPFHFLTATPEQLVKALMTDFRIHFKAKNWENIKLAKKAARYYTPDSGANMHAKISFVGNSYIVQVFVSFEKDDPQLEGIRGQLQWGEGESFGDTMKVLTHEQASGLINDMLKEGVKEIKAMLAGKDEIVAGEDEMVEG